MLLIISILCIFAYSISISFLETGDRWIGFVFELLILVFSISRKEKEATVLALITSTIIALTLLPLTSLWPVPSLLTAIAIGGILWLRRTSYLKLNKQILNRNELIISLLTATVSIVGVILWFFIFKPSLEQSPFHLPNLATPVLIVFLIAFSALNAFAEELLFRGAAFEAVSSKTSLASTNLIQAVAFGLLHFAGFPFGLVGIVLGSIFGLLMGYLRIRTKGIFSPWLAHFMTDLGIAALFLWISK